jgi:hypothetical protein
MPKKRARLHLRLPAADASAIAATAQRLDMSVSKLVRRATMNAVRATLPLVEDAPSLRHADIAGRTIGSEVATA